MNIFYWPGQIDGTTVIDPTLLSKWKYIGTNGLVPLLTGKNVGVGDFTAEPTAKFEVQDFVPAIPVYYNLKAGSNAFSSQFYNGTPTATEATTILQDLSQIYFLRLNSVSNLSRAFSINDADGLLMQAADLVNSNNSKLQVLQNATEITTLDQVNDLESGISVSNVGLGMFVEKPATGGVSAGFLATQTTINMGVNTPAPSDYSVGTFITAALAKLAFNDNGLDSAKVEVANTVITIQTENSGGDKIEIIVTTTNISITVNGANKITIGSQISMVLPSYDDDAAAGVGGLVAGNTYQTTGAGAAPLNVAGIVMIKQ